VTRYFLTSILLVASSAGCAAGLPPVTKLQAERASERWPGTSVAQLEQGRVLYQGRCGNCHQLFSPGHFPEQRWRVEIAEMRERAHLTTDQENLIFQYLATAGVSTPAQQEHAASGDSALTRKVVSE
jgi:mono/diheme cytochrome c family protein